MKKQFDIGDFVPVVTVQSITKELVLRFKKRRKESGLSQKQLSQRSGVSYASIRRFESIGEISLKSLIKISFSIGYLEDFNELYKTMKLHNLKDLK